MKAPKEIHDDTPEIERSRSVVVGTAGHIDHGKTALVYALTGTDTDRLPEEKHRGITIDLGFAALELPDSHGGRLLIDLVDVPGHHAFVRNMLAGATGIDAALLVVAADAGVQPQTEEHLAICSLLGIRRGVIALSKCDLVSAEQRRHACDQVRQLVQHTFLKSAPLIPVSVKSGEGLDELRRALAAVALRTEEKGSARVTRLPVDRAFTVRGFGTVVTGTLQAGVIASGDKLLHVSSGRTLRVRGVQVHRTGRECVVAPSRVACNLSGVEVDELHRGDVLVPEGTLDSVHVIDVQLTMLRDTAPLRHRSRVRLHAFASEVMATVLLYADGDEAEGGSRLARLRLSQPLVLVPGDAFVLRQCSPAATIGGGRVLDAHPLLRQPKAARRNWLEQLSHADELERVRLRIERCGNNGLSIASLVRETGCTAVALRRRLRGQLDSGAVLRVGSEGALTEKLIAKDALARLEDLLMRELRACSSDGATRATLISRLRCDPGTVELVLKRLQGTQRVAIAGETVRVATAAAVPDRTQQLMQAVEEMYRAAGLASPSTQQVAAQLKVDAPAMRDAVTRLLRARRLIRMGDDTAFTHFAALESLYIQIRQYRGQSLDVARFKSLSGLTRKHAIPLLEHLDQMHLTRRAGETRIVV